MHQFEPAKAPRSWSFRRSIYAGCKPTASIAPAVDPLGALVQGVARADPVGGRDAQEAERAPAVGRGAGWDAGAAAAVARVEWGRAARRLISEAYLYRRGSIEWRNRRRSS